MRGEGIIRALERGGGGEESLGGRRAEVMCRRNSQSPLGQSDCPHSGLIFFLLFEVATTYTLYSLPIPAVFMFLALCRRSVVSARFGFSSSSLRHSLCFAHYAPLTAVIPATNMQTQKPRRPEADAGKRKKARTERDNKGSGYDEVLQTDIDQLLKKQQQQDDNGEGATTASPRLPEPFTEIEVQICEQSSTGDGLALSENADHVYVVPFSVPGDTVLVKVARHFPSLSYTLTDFLKVITPGPRRDDSQIGCGYFGKCSGCQLQMLPYEDQLAHKKRIVEKAYANFSGLLPELIPPVEDTFPSPLQYGYRTKLTPHFMAPSGGGGGGGKGRRKGATKEDGAPKEVPPIGFTVKNRKVDMDIEDCPLGTDIVRRGLKSERKRVAENIDKYKRGATLLLRESTTRTPKESPSKEQEVSVEGEQSEQPTASSSSPKTDSGDLIQTHHDSYIQEKRCITDNNAITTEYISDYVFTNKAGAFFQNNNSILPGFTDYIRQRAIPSHTPENANTTTTTTKPIKYLLDAYSGSGLFTITLSPLFKSSLGVDVSADSIKSARQNAQTNNLPHTGFAAADAASLFKDVPYPPDQTCLIIDPPRKGCSEDFLRQFLAFAPRRVVYVSCNVHTQARDVAVMVQGDVEGRVRYGIESLRGFDFFPQTGHVEGVAVLNRVFE